jgi:hypothetical protein
MEKRKPNPVNALRIASVLGCPPAAVVLLRDFRIDMTMNIRRHSRPKKGG